MPKNRTKNSPRPVVEEPYIKDFLDMVAPSVIDFKVDHYLCGNTCRCVWALREYPTSTDEQAILRHLGEMDGVTIRIYTRQVTPSEERRIIDKRFYMDLLQLEEAEYNLIRFPQRGVCLFKCGNERYLLEVHAPAYKEALFGTAGGR
mgnify:CR=1 FL=1